MSCASFRPTSWLLGFVLLLGPLAGCDFLNPHPLPPEPLPPEPGMSASPPPSGDAGALVTGGGSGSSSGSPSGLGGSSGASSASGGSSGSTISAPDFDAAAPPSGASDAAPSEGATGPVGSDATAFLEAGPDVHRDGEADGGREPDSARVSDAREDSRRAPSEASDAPATGDHDCDGQQDLSCNPDAETDAGSVDSD